MVFNYAEEIFKAAGYDVSGVMFNQVITGVVNCVFTVAAMCLVDKWGRRPLMLLGAGGLAVLYSILGGCYYFEVKGIAVLVVVMAAIACYAMTLAPITWVVLSEMFPDRVRGTAMAVAVAWDWWNGFDNGRKCDTKGYERFVDFAAAHGLEYVVLDWYGYELRFGFNIWKSCPAVDVDHLVK